MCKKILNQNTYLLLAIGCIFSLYTLQISAAQRSQKIPRRDAQAQRSDGSRKKPSSINKHYQGTTLLIEAIKRSDVDAVQDLLRQKADANTPDDFDRAPLTYAILRQDPNILIGLAEHNARIPLSNAEFLSQKLATRQETNWKETVRLLCATDAPLNSTEISKVHEDQDLFKHALLCYSCYKNEPMLKQLLAGSDETQINKVRQALLLSEGSALKPSTTKNPRKITRKRAKIRGLQRRHITTTLIKYTLGLLPQEE